MRTLSILTLVAGLAAFPALAQEQTCDPEGSQDQKDRCAYDDFESAAQDMRNATDSVLSGFSNIDLGDRLNDAEKSWEDYRDRQCETEAATREGEPTQNESLARCLERLTRERTDGLMGLLD